MSELLREIRAACKVKNIEPARRIDDKPMLRLDFRCPPKDEGILRLNEHLKRKFPAIKVGRTLGFTVGVFPEDEQGSKNIKEAFDRLYEEKRPIMVVRPLGIPRFSNLFSEKIPFCVIE